MKLREPITLVEFCKRARIRWAVGRRCCLRGDVRAKRDARGFWLVDARDIPAFLKSPPWNVKGRSGPRPTRVFAVHERIADVRKNGRRR
jgi:hypothetical protein